MKMVLAAGMAVLMFGVALPEASQARGNLQVRRLSAQIDRGVHDGSLTRSEARDLRLRLIRVEVLEARDLRHGFTPAETQDLNGRYTAVEADIHAQRTNAQYNVRQRRIRGRN